MRPIKVLLTVLRDSLIEEPIKEEGYVKDLKNYKHLLTSLKKKKYIFGITFINMLLIQMIRITM